MWNKFLREIRGRFELTHQQAIGSLFMVLLMLFIILVPVVYRYCIVKPVKVQEVSTLHGTEEVSQKSAINGIEEKEEVSLPHHTSKTKKHIVIQPLEVGDTAFLLDNTERKWTKKEATFLINLNTADTTQLKSVKGIGSFYAARIVKFRKKLGGFSSVKQLDKVYNFPEEAKNNLIARLESTRLVPYETLNINKVTFKELLSKGILNYEEVKQVFQYRNKTFFYTINDLYKTGLDSTQVEILMPYVVFE